MANLLHRIIFDEELSEGYNAAFPLHEAHENLKREQVGGAEGPAPAAPKGKNNKMEYFQRWNLYFLLFFLSVFLAVIVFRIKGVPEMILKKKRVNDMAVDISKDPTTRWRRIVELTVVFIAFVLAFNLALIAGVGVFKGLTGLFMSKNTKMSEIFWKYTDPYGQTVEIGKTYIGVLLQVCFLTFVCYIGFSKWFPDWFDNMYFQSSGKKKEDTQVQRYLFVYGLFLIAMMLFFMILLDVAVLDSNKLYMFYNIIFFLGYLILTFIIMKEFRMGNIKKLAFISILVFLMFFAYPLLLSLIKLEKSGADAFSGRFLMNMLFNFSIPT